MPRCGFPRRGFHLTFSKKYVIILSALNLFPFLFDSISEIDFKIICKEVMMCVNWKGFCRKISCRFSVT